MALNTDRFGSRIGILKILTIVFGIITVGFIGYSYYDVEGLDEAYLSCVIICLIVSFLWALVIIFDVIHESESLKKLDMLFHMIATVFYLITLLCFVISLIKWRSGKRKTDYRLWQRIFAFIFGVITNAVYGYTALLLYHSTD
ncbi:hypothetical protein Fcan01_08590 [Folsomia candida]|uniref:MARVEL domain-containing protein n=1 Tax=Folsomia candida TaxID=158441 RepID=A0A226EDM6_FOLCA|nr:hypothetical protein Fcan01_08590 [Folsomia candida]